MHSRPYVGWTPLPHDPGCTQARWLVHERDREVIDGIRLELRFICPSCGAAHLLRVDTDTRKDAHWGVRLREATTTRRIGYGCPPRRASGLWLWPEGPSRAPHEPTSYVVTTTKDRPERKEEIAGALSRYRTPRGAPRWVAIVGYDPALRSRDGYRSAGAAAAWLADQLAGSPQAEIAEQRATGPAPGPTRTEGDR